MHTADTLTIGGAIKASMDSVVNAPATEVYTVFKVASAAALVVMVAMAGVVFWVAIEAMKMEEWSNRRW